MSMFKKTFLMLASLGFLFLAGTDQASRSTIFYGPNSIGAANGSDCADAYAYNDPTNGWNVSGKWGGGSAQIGPGTTRLRFAKVRILSRTARVDSPS